MPARSTISSTLASAYPEAANTPAAAVSSAARVTSARFGRVPGARPGAKSVMDTVCPDPGVTPPGQTGTAIELNLVLFYGLGIRLICPGKPIENHRESVTWN